MAGKADFEMRNRNELSGKKDKCEGKGVKKNISNLLLNLNLVSLINEFEKTNNPRRHLPPCPRRRSLYYLSPLRRLTSFFSEETWIALDLFPPEEPGSWRNELSHFR